MGGRGGKEGGKKTIKEANKQQTNRQMVGGVVVQLEDAALHNLVQERIPLLPRARAFLCACVRVCTCACTCACRGDG